MRLSAGSRLGPYQIAGALGAGAMGEVYRARDVRLDRDVALKVLPAEFASDGGRVERFDREARAIAALSHPHIVTIHSIESLDGVRFITMELVEGETLTDVIAAGAVPLPRFADIAVGLTDALAAAHQKQITHRDLKPGNIMVSREGRVKVLDFGLARMPEPQPAPHSETRAALTEMGAIVGTMPYMSPEQIEGLALDPRSDLFSLGIVFYELLTGARPFAGGSSAALMTAILRDTPKSVAEVRPDVPAVLARLIARCLEKRPGDRIQSARELHDELKQLHHILKASGAPVGILASPAAAVGQEHSIGVLPFADLSASSDQGWFCDGIAEEILNALAPLPGLRVAARASSFSLRGSADDLAAIGRKLNVLTVLEGSVRRAGDRVRITAQLSDVSQGRQLWSERFDRELKDIFDVQDEIAHAIVDRLKVTLAGSGQARLVPRVTSNLDAYERLLRGRELLTRRGRAIHDAMRCFEDAVALDPELAEAHALLGDAHRLTALYGLRPAHDAMPRARAAVERALAIDPAQVEALATLANITATYDWNVAAATAISDRVIALDPSHVRALAERAISLAATESLPPATQARLLDDVRRARALDPLNAWVLSVEAMCLACTGRLQESLAVTEQAMALDGENFTARWTRVVTLAWMGRDAEAIAAAESALPMSGRHPRLLAEVAAVHGRRGDLHAARAIQAELDERAADTHVGQAERAAVTASAGDLEQARRLLAEALDARDPFLRFLRFPAWSAVRDDAGCAILLRRSPLLR